MASTYLSKTITPGDHNGTTFTVSGWYKIDTESHTSNNPVFSFHGSSDYTTLRVGNGNSIDFLTYDGSVNFRKVTSQKLRDCNGWYHLVFVADTTNGTADDRIRIYINGNRVTSFSNSSNPSSSFNLINSNKTEMNVGSEVDQTPTRSYFGGNMSHIHYCDGYAYDASNFGQTDSTTGEWAPKTSPSVSYGTEGFFLKFENSGSMGTDSSGNGNNLTVNGNLTQTIDTPTHNFCTLNPLIPHGANLTFSNGNLSLATSSSQWQGALASIAPNGGKYYFETKYNTGTGIKLDIARVDADIRNMTVSNNSYLSYTSLGYGYQLNNTGYDYYCNNNTCTTWNTGRGNSTKIIMVALDFDNGKMWIGDSGTWYNKSGTANPETGDDPLHDFSSDLNGENWFINMSCEGSGTAHNLNFGGGFFGTTAVSTAGTNASNIGTFEYDVPSGYTALTSKGLNE